MLLDALAAPAPDYATRANLATALRHPWCWPGRIRSAVRVPAAPRPLRVGEALVATVSDDGRPGALLALAPADAGGAPDVRGVPIVGEALAALRRAERLVTRDLPLVAEASALGRPVTWTAQRVWREDLRTPLAALDGGSCGAALVLACASRLLGRPVAADLAASAAVDARGRLSAVAGIGAKVRLLAGSAPRVRRLVVAAEQVGEARAAAAALPRARLEVRGAATVAELVELGFGRFAARAPEAWSEPRRAAAAARELFRLALDGSPVLGWRHVAAAARAAGRRLPPGADRDLARFAERVALRHEGAGGVALPWPSPAALAALPAPVRLSVLAHVVQARCDAGAADLAATVARAQAALPARLEDHHEGDLRLRGAVGRALARLRRQDEAAAALHGAVEGWFAIFRPAEASYALCELLRVEALRGRPAGVRRACARAEALLAEPGCDGVAAAFVAVAAGRALAQVGRPRAALAWLAPARFALTRADAEAAALRWRARALEALGRTAAAAGAREALAALAPASEQRALARLDAALARGDRRGAAAIAARLARQRPRALAHVLGGAPAAERARRVADEFPY